MPGSVARTISIFAAVCARAAGASSDTAHSGIATVASRNRMGAADWGRKSANVRIIAFEGARNRAIPAIECASMCLLAIFYRTLPDAPLLVAANREEFFDRPFLPPHVQGREVKFLAGLDVRARGTWLGVNERGLV